MTRALALLAAAAAVAAVAVAAPAELAEAPEPTLGDAGGKLSGFFVMPCRQWYPVDGKNVSVFQTRYYYHDTNTYQIDTTYYLNDAHCTPKDSDIYMKTYFEGHVTYPGKNKVIKDAWRANLTWTGGLYYFAGNVQAQYTVGLLNRECPCGGEWKVDEFRNVSASDCEPATKDETHLCQIITGNDDLFNYEWLDDTHYITSQDCFEDEVICWNNPLIPGYIRERIPESGNQDPDNCDYVLWAKCGAGIERAQTNCDTCIGLECDGCIFRELNPDWDPDNKKTDLNDWYDCCPCIYRYAEEYDKAWLKTRC